MCLKVTSDTLHAIAKEDIVVYKFGEDKPEGFVPIMYNTMVYEVNKISPKVGFTMINNNIERGYHSYDLVTVTRLLDRTYLKKGITRVQRFNGDIETVKLTIGRFVIPKNTEYYKTVVNKGKNKWTMLVATQLIYKGEL